MINRGMSFDRPLTSSRANSSARRLYVQHHSPAEEALSFDSDPQDPGTVLPGFSPLGWAADKANRAAQALAAVGRFVWQDIANGIGDIWGTARAAATGDSGWQEGPIFKVVTGIAEAVGSRLPGPAKTALGIPQDQGTAGYLIGPDGRRYTLPTAPTAQDQGEKSLTSATIAALQKSRLDLATANNRLAIANAANKLDADRIDRTLALAERTAARNARGIELNDRIKELAIESGERQLADWDWWARPSKLDTSDDVPRRKVRSVGTMGGGDLTISLY